MDIRRERILSGIMTLLILSKLCEGPAHGYLLESYIEEKLKRSIPPGTVYVLLSTLKRRGFVVVKSKEIVKGRQIATYEIKPEGIRFLRQHKEPLNLMKSVIEDLLKKLECV
ncbi:MAG: PadR family transcriptional regulator [Thermoplasmatales archaeon]